MVVPDLDAAYRGCERRARAHYENFPVASWLLPASMRPHVAAVYAFARIADDLADEGTGAPADRLSALDAWDARLVEAAGGRVDLSQPDADVFVALTASMRACHLPLPLLRDLLSAFRQDVTVHRYATWADLMDYCRRSANPIGRLVLRIAGVDDPGADEASDAVCTALQLTNFWQDLEVDFLKGRIYVPDEIRRATGAADDDLSRRTLTAGWRTALADVTERTRLLFEAGRPVCDLVDGRLRWELRATWLGGTRVLAKLEAAGFDVFRGRPRLTAADAAVIGVRTLAWTAA